MDGGSDSDSDHFLERESSSDDEETDDEGAQEYLFNTNRQRIKENDPDTTELYVNGNYEVIRNMTDEEWEELGRDISNNTYLEQLKISDGALDDQTISFFFRGLMSSSSMKRMSFFNNGLSVDGVRSMTPFLQNANNLNNLRLRENLQSEGFNMLFLALRDSPIERLFIIHCGIESIEIDRNSIPQNLEYLYLHGNSIDTDGCRELAKLLQGADPTLTDLILGNNIIDDEGVAILVDALQSNTSLKDLDLSENEGISVEGAKLCLQLVNDISTIKATLQSNHTLQLLTVKEIQYDDADDDDVHAQIQRQIDYALQINRNHKNDPKAAGRQKVIQTQLHSGTRAGLANVQGVDRSLYSEINPLHLPEVLALVGRRHGQRELYVALKSSIAGVISTVNRKECIQQQMACIQQQMASYAARLDELGAELAAINEAEGDVVEIGSESRSNKRRRA